LNMLVEKNKGFQLRAKRPRERKFVIQEGEGGRRIIMRLSGLQPRCGTSL